MKKGPVNFMGIDGVDTVADLIKWLEYDVLVADFADSLETLDTTTAAASAVASSSSSSAVATTPSFLAIPSAESLTELTGVTSALFGAVAALSSQIYRDATLSVGYGTEAARAELAERTPRGWATTYVKATGSSALLFGGYETLRKPLTTLALEYVSGSAQACLGSTQYDQCVDVYLLDAVPSALIQSLVG